MLLNYCKYDSVSLVGPLEKISTFSRIISGKYLHQFPGINSTPQGKIVCVEINTDFPTTTQAANLNTKLFPKLFIHSMVSIHTCSHRLGDSVLPFSLTVKNLCSLTARTWVQFCNCSFHGVKRESWSNAAGKGRNY